MTSSNSKKVGGGTPLRGNTGGYLRSPFTISSTFRAAVDKFVGKGSSTSSSSSYSWRRGGDGEEEEEAEFGDASFMSGRQWLRAGVGSSTLLIKDQKAQQLAASRVYGNVFSTSISAPTTPSSSMPPSSSSVIPLPDDAQNNHAHHPARPPHEGGVDSPSLTGGDGRAARHFFGMQDEERGAWRALQTRRMKREKKRRERGGASSSLSALASHEEEGSYQRVGEGASRGRNGEEEDEDEGIKGITAGRKIAPLADALQEGKGEAASSTSEGDGRMREAGGGEEEPERGGRGGSSHGSRKGAHSELFISEYKRRRSRDGGDGEAEDDLEQGQGSRERGRGGEERRKIVSSEDTPAINRPLTQNSRPPPRDHGNGDDHHNRHDGSGNKGNAVATEDEIGEGEKESEKHHACTGVSSVGSDKKDEPLPMSYSSSVSGRPLDTAKAGTALHSSTTTHHNPKSDLLPAPSNRNHLQSSTWNRMQRIQQMREEALFGKKKKKK